jgi:hypothetical protein
MPNHRAADLFTRNIGEVGDFEVKGGRRREQTFLTAVVAHHHGRVNVGGGGYGPDRSPIVAFLQEKATRGVKNAIACGLRSKDLFHDVTSRNLWVESLIRIGIRTRSID